LLTVAPTLATGRNEMESYLFIKERESQEWILHSELRRESFKDGRKTRYILKTSIYPKPEAVSPFIEAHKIIKAESEEEAWQKLNLK